MAPETVTDENPAMKRKREHDEHVKRKRAKRDRLSSVNTETNGLLPQEPTAGQVNGLKTPTKQEEKAIGALLESNGKIAKKEKRRHRWVQETHTRPSSTWKVSKPMGGRMLDIDPVLTNDEKRLILPYNTSIQVYSATDSLLVRKIQLSLSANSEAREQIVSLCLSTTSPNFVWVASSAGQIWLVDWTTGHGSRSPLKLGCDSLRDMSVDPMQIDKEMRDVLFVSIQRSEKWHILACDVRGRKLNASKILVSQKQAIHNLRSVKNGQALAASSERDVLLGTPRTPSVSSVDKLDYVFFTMDASDDITCLDVRATDRIHLNRKSQVESGDTPVVEIVVGCARGGIFFYNDLLPQVRFLYSSKTRNYSLQPRKFHWHRKAVHAVKWSPDGNYIISGGSESTLVLWQLDTQKMDFLPHLSATIANIVVSARGSSYILHLDDNSAMVLSTAEMKPTTYVSGIQTIISPKPFSKDEAIRRIGQYPVNRISKTPAVVSPVDNSRILLCVGNGQHISHSGSGPSTPLIQTVDLTTMQSISKQALTRTHPTDVNTTDKGHAITEPRITGMAYSQDGRWLATTDEWQPPTRDVNSLEGSAAERREVYLKFWSVSAEDQSLELVSRINAPHYTGRSEPIFGLAADPKSQRFATIGEDGVARLWQPTIRQRDGVLVKGKQGRQLQSWACAQSISLFGNEAAGESDALTNGPSLRGSGSISFSEDGSTLVCAIGHEYGSAVYIIDAETGTICNSLHGLINGDVQDIKVLSTNLIVLSDTLVVYDMVLDELRYGVQLRTNDETHGPGASILTHLAVDYQTSSFAVAVSRSKQGSGTFRSELAVFTTNRSEPEIVRQFPHPLISVVDSIGSSGFLVLDSAAQIWPVSEGVDIKSLAFARPLADLNLDHDETVDVSEAGPAIALLAGGDDESVSGDEMDVDMADDGIDEDGNYPAVVAPQKLAELFDTAPPFAMPPVEDMFYQVTKLFSTKQAVPVT